MNELLEAPLESEASVGAEPIQSNDISRLTIDDKEVTLVATAHVSRESANLVEAVIRSEKPDTVCVELCDSRMQAINNPDQWRNMNIVKVVKEKKAFLLLSNLLLASFQKQIAKKFGIKPGEEMIRAINVGREVEAQIVPADREIRVTLTRTWRLMKFWSKIKLFFQSILSFGAVDDITEEDIEKMKEQDMLESMLSEISKELPEVRSILIDERDRYLAAKIRSAPGKKIVAVVGAGHAPGIRRYWDQDIDLPALEELPPPGKAMKYIKWILPAIIIGIIVYGFIGVGKEAGMNMIVWWLLANGVLAGLGAVLALAHPLTILTAIVAAPLTSLNPMIAAGWVSGLVETFSRKPTVSDFENLTSDISSYQGILEEQDNPHPARGGVHEPGQLDRDVRGASHDAPRLFLNISTQTATRIPSEHRNIEVTL